MKVDRYNNKRHSEAAAVDLKIDRSLFHVVEVDRYNPNHRFVAE